MQETKVKCQEPGCNHEGVPCFFPDNHTDVADECYCTKHTFIHGFCYGCGRFYSGIERFDFPEYYGIIRGLCENCDDEIKTSLGEYDEEDHDFYPVYPEEACQ